MFNLKNKFSLFFKGDRELSWWYIPITLIWLFIAIGEAARISQSTPDQITLQILRFLPPSPVSLFLDTFLYAILLSTGFYLAFRYLSKWLVFILMPLCGIVFEFIWCRGDIAGFSASQGIPVNWVIPFWVVIWLLCWGIPYFITKLWKSKLWKKVHFLLIIGGIVVFFGTQQLGLIFPNFPPALGGFITVILSPLLIASGIVYRYKPHYITKLKSVPFLLIVLGILVFIGGSSLADALNLPALGVIGLLLSLILIASGVAYWLYKRRYRKRKK